MHLQKPRLEGWSRLGTGGEAWDAAARSWYGEPDFEDDDVEGWIASGARLVGGCCRVGPQQIAQLAATAAVPRPR